MKKFSEKKLNEALFKRAVGYETDEVAEEYSVNERGDYVLSKRKITRKHFSPDLTAAKLLLERFSDSGENMIKEMSEEEINKKRLELIELLSKNKNDQKELQEAKEEIFEEEE